MSKDTPDDLLRRIAELEGENRRLADEVCSLKVHIMEIEEELRGSFDSLPGLMCTLTPDMRVDYINRPLLDYFGMTPEEIKGWKSNELVHPDDLEPLIAENRRAAETGEPYEYERRCRRRDGTFRWLQMRGRPIRNANGDIIRWYSLLFDIEDRKRAQEALLDSEQKLSRIVNSMPMLVWSTDSSGAAEFFNEKWVSFTGIDTEHARGEGWTDVLHPEDFLSTVERWKALVTLQLEETADWEVRLRRHDGEYRWFLVRANAFRDATGAIVSWFGTNTDIHDRKLAEDQLRRSETTLLEAQRIARMGSFARRARGSDIRAHDIIWSEGLYRIFEVDRSTAINFKMMEERIYPDDVPMWWDKIVKAQMASSSFETEIRLLMPDGNVKYISISAYLTKDLEGNPEYIGTVQDITQRRMTEDTINQVRGDLAHATRAASLGVLTAAIAHEINQPLSGIKTSAGTCLRILKKTSPDISAAVESAQRAIRDVNRTAEIMSRLRKLFKHKVINFEPVDLNDATREIIRLSMAEIRREKISLHEDLSSDIPEVSGDRVQLQQVILNFLRNAVDAIKEVDGPRIIRVSTRHVSGNIQLSVEDSGKGFDEEIVEMMFSAFFSTKPDGMGIGLSVSESIIEEHGGSLQAVNNDELGATFSFQIPVLYTPMS
jgi:PAS domain S-box-containing protein